MDKKNTEKYLYKVSFLYFYKIISILSIFFCDAIPFLYFFFCDTFHLD